MVIGAEAHEPPASLKLIRHPEPEQVRIEVVGLVEVRHVEPKMAQASILKGLSSRMPPTLYFVATEICAVMRSP